MRIVIAFALLAACAHTRTVPASAASRCTVRFAENGLFVDGERMSHGDAVAYCQRTEGAIVIVEQPAKTWDARSRSMVPDETSAVRTERDETLAALEREGIRVYVRGPLCHDPRTDGCRPITRTPMRKAPARLEATSPPP